MYRQISKQTVLLALLFTVSWLPVQAAEPDMKECFVLATSASEFFSTVSRARYVAVSRGSLRCSRLARIKLKLIR